MTDNETVKNQLKWLREGRLSVSAIGTFSQCERKFAHRYIWKSENDSDYVTPNNLKFGRAFHKALELSKHNPAKVTIGLIRSLCEENDLDFNSDGAKLTACLRVYLKGVDKRTKPITVEIMFETKLCKGYMDLIYIDGNGFWWISDMKTVGVKLDPGVKTKVLYDNQMNMYFAHSDVVAAKLGLDPAKFGGISYREIEKPRNRYKDGEGFNAFLKRCEESFAKSKTPIYRDTQVSAEDFLKNDHHKMVIEQMMVPLSAIKNIASPEDTKKNPMACKAFHQPCEYWSKCYGKTYTEQQKEQDDAAKQTGTILG